MKNRLVVFCILSILCIMMAADHGEAAPVHSNVTVVSPARSSREGKLERLDPLHSHEALITRVSNNTSPVYFNRIYDWGKRSIPLFVDTRLFLISQFGLKRLSEMHCSSNASSPPIYLVNRVFLI